MAELERERQEFVIGGTRKGLGIRIVGGRNMKVPDSESDFGVFIKEVIRGSLADRDGNLKRGDQLLEANEISLVGVSNEKAVETLKSCAMSDEITVIISRDSKSQTDFRRLSNSLLLQPVTSIPRGAEPAVDTGAFQNVYHERNGFEETKRLSTSSELTQISTTDISSHGDDLDDEISDPVALNENPQSHATNIQKSINLSDIEVRMDTELQDNSLPPPLPNSPPPSFEDEDYPPKKRKPEQAEVAMAVAGSAATNVVLRHRNRSSPKGKHLPPLFSANPSPSILPTLYTFVIPKTAGLGMIIAGGVGRPDGPNIIIDRILDGLDAAKDGKLQKGDVIASINDENFKSLTREKALAILSRLKINRNITNYNVIIERQENKHNESGPPGYLPSPVKTPNFSIFESDTLPASEASRAKRTHDESIDGGGSPSKKSTPLQYLGKRDSDIKRKDKYDSMHRRLSMDPNARCKLDKLEWAMRYMGNNITPQQRDKIHSSLDIDENGGVIFIEFVKLAQEMFMFNLDSHMENDLMLALVHRDDLEMPNIPKKSISYEHIHMKEPVIKPSTSQPTIPLSSLEQDKEMEQMRNKLHELGSYRDQERILNDSMIHELEREKKLIAQLKKELYSREKELKSKEKELKSKEKELREVKMIDPNLSEKETAILLRKIKMIEDAHKAERDRSNQLEDSIRDMNAELSILRESQPKMTLDDLRKRLALIENERNKETSLTRRNQVAVDHLMQFVENCHEVLVKSPDVDRILYHPHGKGLSVQRGNAVTGNPRPPQYLSRHAKQTATSLAQEAKETIAAVRKIMETEVLPFGWEEAYTEDGQKYYMNHKTQMTSWVHPVTRVSSSMPRGGGGSRSSQTPSIAADGHTPSL